MLCSLLAKATPTFVQFQAGLSMALRTAFSLWSCSSTLKQNTRMSFSVVWSVSVVAKASMCFSSASTFGMWGNGIQHGVAVTRGLASGFNSVMTESQFKSPISPNMSMNVCMNCIHSLHQAHSESESESALLAKFLHTNKESDSGLTWLLMYQNWFNLALNVPELTLNIKFFFLKKKKSINTKC